MRRGARSRADRAGLLASLVAVLLVTVTAGALALVHYSGASLAGSTGGGPGAGARRAGPARLGPAASPETERAGSPSPSPSAGRSAARLAAARARRLLRHPPAGRGAALGRAVRPLGAGPAHAGEQGDEPRLQPHPGAARRQRLLPGGRPAGGRRLLAPRINGDFTGTTSEILRWAACKWGINQNIVFAQAAVESWWNQTTLGDWGTDAAACPPGHGPGAGGKPGQCPQSYGILQNRYPFEQASWPGIADSTAMNADTAYAIWRSCYDGYETWLNNVPHGRPYRAGDVWGCVGRWFAGRWHTAPAQQYIAKVRQYLAERIWTTPDFQQPG